MLGCCAPLAQRCDDSFAWHDDWPSRQCTEVGVAMGYQSDKGIQGHSVAMHTRVSATLITRIPAHQLKARSLHYKWRYTVPT